MKFKTFGELKLKVQRETDTEFENFVTPEELQEYFQEAVDECAAHIYKIWPLACHYFEKIKMYDLAVGQQLLDLPSDIYARAITRFVFNGQGRVFTIERMTRSTRHADIAEMAQFQGGNDGYRYVFTNEGPDRSTQIQLWPKSVDAGEQLAWLWYVRQPIQIVDESSLIDIPEFYYYITAYVKLKILQKAGEATAPEAQADRDEKRKLMLETLAEMTPDEDSLSEGDYSFYEEMS